MLSMTAHKSLSPTTSLRPSFKAVPSSPRTRSALAGKTIQAFTPPPKAKGGACGCGGSCCKGNKPSTAKAVQAMQQNLNNDQEKLTNDLIARMKQQGQPCFDRLIKAPVRWASSCLELSKQLESTINMLNEQLFTNSECAKQSIEAELLAKAFPENLDLQIFQRRYAGIVDFNRELVARFRQLYDDSAPEVVAKTARNGAITDLSGLLKRDAACMQVPGHGFQ